MEAIIYDNVVLKDDCEYVLYVGQLKTLCYLQFVVEYMQKLEGRKFGPIAIISDGRANYPKGNIIALNPLIAKLKKEVHERVSWRIADNALFQALSQSNRVTALVDELLSRQESLNTIVFNHTPSFSLANRQGVRVIGPKAHIAHKWNSKFYQFRALEKIVPIPLSMEVDSLIELQRKLPDFAKLCPSGMFVCTEYGGGGSNSFIAKDANAIYSRLSNFSETVRISKYLAHSYDPTVLAVVANEKDVYIGAIADQNIVDGNKFKGSTHPSTLPAEVLSKLREYTKAVGQQLGKSGYRGIFGCDYIANKECAVHFVEVNARKQGTTMEMICTLENCLPPNTPSLLEMEYWAVTKEKFPQGWQDWPRERLPFYWGTYNYMLDSDAFTIKNLPTKTDERHYFREFAAKECAEKTYLVLEHPGKNCLVKAGSYLARLVALGPTLDSVAHQLELGKREIEMTLKGHE